MRSQPLSSVFSQLLSGLRERAHASLERLSPRLRQVLTAAALFGIGFLVLWVVLSMGGSDSKRAAFLSQSQSGGRPGDLKPTNVDLMAPGAQVRDIDRWVGTAGHKLAQYENERDEQKRINRERKEATDQLAARFAELEARLKSPAISAAASATTGTASPISAMSPNSPTAAASAAATPTPANSPSNNNLRYPPASALPPGLAQGQLPPSPGAARSTVPPYNGPWMANAPMNGQAWNAQLLGQSGLPAPMMTRVTLPASNRRTADNALPGTTTSGTPSPNTASFLPVSFTRGVLLGGLDAPTGGQAQSNPHPVLIRLSDNTVLPNRFRAEYRECFVIAAGFGDISSERAYLRTETLSCVREDGNAMEVKIQGSVYGEDGKVGLRGRLVSKQGQMLANALLAGIASGLGQGIATASTSVSSSALGQIATLSGTDALKAGLGSGVGRALDRLAQYYIQLAEKTFPVIEIDADREIDVVVTKGVVIDNASWAKASVSPVAWPNGPSNPGIRATKVNDDED